VLQPKKEIVISIACRRSLLATVEPGARLWRHFLTHEILSILIAIILRALMPGRKTRQSHASAF